jgi:Na+/proline symporter
MIACWALAAGLMSLLTRRATRPAAVGGALAGALAAFAVGPLVTGGEHIHMPTVVQTALSLILVFVVIALGPPVAAETDD